MKFLRDHKVVRRLRFMRIGDGLGADFEVALGRRQLFGGRRLLRTGRFQVVLRAQHVEISLRHAGDQVLLRLGEYKLQALVANDGFTGEKAMDISKKFDTNFPDAH